MKKCIFIGTVCLLMYVMPCFAQQQRKIIVGKNVQVNPDGNFQHFEYSLAVNPKNPKNILIGSITEPEDGYEMQTKIYRTNNGGSNWVDTRFPEVTINGGVDPQVAFNKKGTAFFTTYGNMKNKENEKVGCLYFYKSKDEGKTWERSTSENLYWMACNDHPQMTVDRTDGKYSGRIYIGVLGDDIKNKFPNRKISNQYTLRLLRSDNEGKTFTQPQIFASSNQGMGINVTNLLVSSKGTLFLTYNEFYRDKSLPDYTDGSNMYLVCSRDGGESFSSSKVVVKRNIINGEIVGKLATPLSLTAQYAIDDRSRKFRDRLYCVYSDLQEKNAKVMLTYSKDEGETWSKPKQVDINAPVDADQYQAAVTVNADGIVGIRWFDTRGTKYTKGYNEYFTASLDGGETFLNSVKVSSEMSTSTSELLKLEFGLSWKRSRAKDSLIASFIDATSVNMIGGHYLQFNTDANGVFHDVWADRRDGRGFQIFTSAIRVVEQGFINDPEKGHKDDIKIEKNRIDMAPRNKNLGSISQDVFLQMGAASFDTSTQIFSIPVSVKNISNRPIYGPIKVEIGKMDTTARTKFSDGSYVAKNVVPVIINSDNNKIGAGAEYIYTIEKTGVSNVLMPGEETAAKVWQFNIKIPRGEIHRYTKEEKEANEKFGVTPDYWVEYFWWKVADLQLNVVGYVGNL